ncbi:MAG TPA: ABC transporter substrate-binding protein, partial [Devosia sp.]|nr:ABC transporter substrate-binding protein [Devosia sp.]
TPLALSTRRLPNRRATRAVIEAPDDRTVVIKLKQQSRTFLRGMAERQGMVHAASAYADIAQKPIGTGPYMVGEYVQDSHLRLVRNPDYWGEAPKMETVTIRFIPDSTAAINAMLAGEADAYLGMSPETYERIETQNLDYTFNVAAFDEGGSTGIRPMSCCRSRRDHDGERYSGEGRRQSPSQGRSSILKARNHLVYVAARSRRSHGPW